MSSHEYKSASESSSDKTIARSSNDFFALFILFALTVNIQASAHRVPDQPRSWETEQSTNRSTTRTLYGVLHGPPDRAGRSHGKNMIQNFSVFPTIQTEGAIDTKLLVVA